MYARSSGHTLPSGNGARECLIGLNKTSVLERDEIGRLNDKFVDIIEHVHFLEAERNALLHDIDIKKSGKLNYSSGINNLFEVEISSLHVVAENCISSRQHFHSEQNSLEHEVSIWSEKWRSITKASLGIPKEVDEEFVRLSQIEAENNLVLRRIKYLEDKHKGIGYKNNLIRDEINMMRMRTDQAVSLHQEYSLRQSDLITSIRNMKTENERIIMNEHKFFVSDRSADRHAFRTSLHQALAEIRADYEQRRLINERTIQENTERKIREINIGGEVIRKRDHVREEIVRTNESLRVLHNQFSDSEIRNAHLVQQIESLTYEIQEESRLFEISLSERQAEIDRMKADCTKLSVEMEKLCDCNVSLTNEIARYRQLLDDSARVGAVSTHRVGTGATVSTSRYQGIGTGAVVGTGVGTTQYQKETVTSVKNSRHGSESHYQTRPESSSSYQIGTGVTVETPRPGSAASYRIGTGATTAAVTTQQISESRYQVGTGTGYETIRPDSGLRHHIGTGAAVETTRHESESRYQIGTGTGAGSSRHESESRYQIGTGLDTTHHATGLDHQIGTGASFSHSSTGTTVYNRSPAPVRQFTPTPEPIRSIPYVFQETPLPVIPPPRSPRYNHRTYDSESSTGVSTVISHSSDTRLADRYKQQRETIDTYHDRTDVRPIQSTTTTFPVITPIVDTSRTTHYSYGRDNGVSYDDSNLQARTETVASYTGQSHVDNRTQFEGNSAYLNTGRNEQCVKNIHSQDVNSSFDEDHFQRFTRWYKGRVKISDVTTNYISLENRSAKHSSDIGGYRIIHEFGESSVFVDLPAGLILGPKETLKIFSKNSNHEYGTVVADIPNFDTTTLSNTSIRNNENEVKSWFVYTSNSDTTEHLI